MTPLLIPRKPPEENTSDVPPVYENERDEIRWLLRVMAVAAVALALLSQTPAWDWYAQRLRAPQTLTGN